MVKKLIMCKWGTYTEVVLCQPKKVSKREILGVDSCIAPLVQMLNDYGVHTLGACCGHRKYKGVILYEQDDNIYELLVNGGDHLPEDDDIPYEEKALKKEKK